jgi:hypothetical protein
MAFFEILFEVIIEPLFGLCFEIGFFIYDMLIPRSKDRDMISKAFNIVLAIIGSLLIGILLTVIALIFIFQ